MKTSLKRALSLTLLICVTALPGGFVLPSVAHAENLPVA